jgi:ubiquinone/menaquinone biosynthesis C-methylase UbiE
MLASRDSSRIRAQQVVNSYFAQEASYWSDIYRLYGVKEFVHQERLRIVLDLVDRLSLPTETRALDVGCGGGWAATALAAHGCSVTAMDPVQEMVDATRDRAKTHKVADKVRATLGDVHSLPFVDNAFDIVLAIGVLPWLPSIEPPLREMHRVLRSGGYLIVTLDNHWSLRWLLEPLTNPMIRPVKESLKRLLRLFGHERPGAPWYPMSRSKFDSLLAATRFVKLLGTTLGFGPFTCLNRQFLPFRVGMKVHRTLQHLADRGFPLLRSAGCHYIVLSTKAEDFRAKAPSHPSRDTDCLMSNLHEESEAGAL